MGWLDDVYGFGKSAVGKAVDMAANPGNSVFGANSPNAQPANWVLNPAGQAGQALVSGGPDAYAQLGDAAYNANTSVAGTLGLMPDQTGPFGVPAYQGQANMDSTAATASGADPAQLNALQAKLQQMYSGQGPSLAAQQAQQQTQAAAGNALGMLGSQRGLNPAQAARMAGNQLAGLNAQGIQAATNARLAEQLGALGQAGQVAGEQANLQQGNQQFNAAQQNAALQAALQRQYGMQQQQNQGIQQQYLSGRQATPGAVQQGVKTGAGLLSTLGGAAAGGL